MRLLERLPDMEHYRINAYGVYGCLPVNKHRIGKGGVMNRNEELHAVLRCKLSKFVRRTKGYSKTNGVLTLSIA